MELIRHPAGVYSANCYIVSDSDSSEGFIIDPGGDAEELLEIIKNNNLSIKFIILTHGHFDHTGAVNSIKKTLGIPVYTNQSDSYLLSEGITIDSHIKDGDTKAFGNESLVIIETPGHTPGSITIKVDDCIFTGDTLFAGSVGRTDLPGGSHSTLIKSIKEKLTVLPDHTKVYPGHGPSSTIGREKMQNPFL